MLSEPLGERRRRRQRERERKGKGERERRQEYGERKMTAKGPRKGGEGGEKQEAEVEGIG